MLQRIQDRLKAYKAELEETLDELIRQKVQEKNIPSIEEFRRLQNRIQSLEQERDRLLRREAKEKKRNPAPDVPLVHIEFAPCKLCARPQYRMGYCLFHFEEHFLGE